MIFNINDVSITCNSVSNDIKSETEINYSLKSVPSAETENVLAELLNKIKTKEEIKIDGLNLELKEIFGEEDRLILIFIIK